MARRPETLATVLVLLYVAGMLALCFLAYER